METYPNLDNEKKESVNYQTTDSRKNIASAYDSMRKRSKQIIEKALAKKVGTINKEIARVPEIYKKLKNNLTMSNNKAKKDMEEHIANTGNHTASGYALSQRMDNNNEYQKSLNNISLEEKSKLSELSGKIADAYNEAEAEKLKALSEYDYKELQDSLKETERIDKLNEEKRVNDSKIKKTESDIKLDNEKNQREAEKHNLEMQYEPEVYKTKIAKTNAEIAKIKASSSGGSSKSQSKSKLSAKDIAESIRLQASELYYDENGKEIRELDDFKAYTFLLTWKNKYDLSDQVVNDASIYLGIQGYM